MPLATAPFISVKCSTALRDSKPCVSSTMSFSAASVALYPPRKATRRNNAMERALGTCVRARGPPPLVRVTTNIMKRCGGARSTVGYVLGKYTTFACFEVQPIFWLVSAGPAFVAHCVPRNYPHESPSRSLLPGEALKWVATIRWSGLHAG